MDNLGAEDITLNAESMVHVVTPDGVSSMPVCDLAQAFRGGMNMHDTTIFLVEESAVAYCHRLELIERGTRALQRLEDDALETIVNTLHALQDEQVEKTLDKCC